MKKSSDSKLIIVLWVFIGIACLFEFRLLDQSRLEQEDQIINIQNRAKDTESYYDFLLHQIVNDQIITSDQLKDIQIRLKKVELKRWVSF
jgi:hypothetical protein